MNSVYKAAGITKQGFHQKMNRILSKLEIKAQLLPLINKIRKDHPTMSARVMYKMLQPHGLGRDAFIEWIKEEGFLLAKKRRFKLTTDSTKTKRFSNLIAGHKLTGINQVWVSDITYYQIGDRYYYITLIMDLYSRKIVGYYVSSSLKTNRTTLAALQMAIMQSNRSLKGLIFHSDGGGQYYSKEFIDKTKPLGIRNSMSYQVFENSHAERLIGVIKNNYVAKYNPTSLMKLKQALAHAVKMYNEQKPHSSLMNMAPVEFEKYIENKESKHIEMWITPRYIPVKVTNISTCR